MYCINCGQELPDSANYCLKCGKPQKDNIEDFRQSKPLYETCEITVCDDKNAGFFSNKVILWASAVGPKGSYNAGETASVPGEYNSIHHYNMPKSTAETWRELDKLRSKLMNDGWEPTGQSNQFSFWTFTFKRRVN